MEECQARKITSITSAKYESFSPFSPYVVLVARPLSSLFD
jgi:hypothetical protein